MRRISRHALRSHDNSKRIKIRRIAQTTSWSRATRIDSANTPPRTTHSHDVFKVDYLKATQLVHLTMLVRTQLMMETVPVTSSHGKKLEVTEMKMCRWACGHTLRDHVRNENIKERLKVESITEVQESATRVVWPRKEARPRLRRKTDFRDGSTREKKARKTEAEMDGLCQPRHESHRNDERRGP